MSQKLSPIILFFIANFLCAQTEEIRMDILSLLAPQELHIQTLETSPFEIKLEGDDVRRLMVNAGEMLIIRVDENRIEVSIDKSDVPFSAACTSVEIERSTVNLTVTGNENYSRKIQAKLKVSFREDRLGIIAFLPLEQAVAEITAAELGGRDVPAEALKAQAVCVRSYLTKNLAAQFQKGIEDTTSDMLYRGRDGAFGADGPLSIQQGFHAAEATKGLVLSFEDQLWPAYFHASCGGDTRHASEVFGQTPLIKGYDGDAVSCEFCKANPAISWSWRIGRKELGKKVFGQAVENVQLTSSSVLVQMNGNTDTKVLSPDNFRIAIGREFGWDSLRSNSYIIRREPEWFVFEGSGTGHNVGLCQVGAKEAARKGMDWKEILKFYFPSCHIRKAADLVRSGRR